MGSCFFIFLQAMANALVPWGYDAPVLQYTVADCGSAYNESNRCIVFRFSGYSFDAIIRSSL